MTLARRMLLGAIYSATACAEMATRESQVMAEALAVTRTPEMTAAILDAHLDRCVDAYRAELKRKLLAAWRAGQRIDSAMTARKVGT